MGRKIGKSAIEVMRERFPANASEIETYADAFDVLAEKVKSGGGNSDLPAVTTDDNGKVLLVSGGKWGANYPIIPNEIVHVPFTVTIGEGGAMNATTTAQYNDVLLNVTDNKTVIADVTIPNGVSFFAPLTAKSDSGAWLAFGITAQLDEPKKPTFYEIVWSETSVIMRTSELT